MKVLNAPFCPVLLLAFTSFRQLLVHYLCSHHEAVKAESGLFSSTFLDCSIKHFTRTLCKGISSIIARKLSQVISPALLSQACATRGQNIALKLRPDVRTFSQ
jgi:hypothetical protein